MKIILFEHQLKKLINEGYHEINELISLSKEIVYAFFKANPTLFDDYFDATDKTQTYDEKLTLSQDNTFLFSNMFILPYIIFDFSKYPLLSNFINRSDLKIRFTDEIKKDSDATYTSSIKYIKVRLNYEYINVGYALKAIKSELKPDSKKIFIRDYFKFWVNGLMHELQHAYDEFRSKEKYIETKEYKKYIKKASPDDTKNTLNLYLNIPHEIWARFTTTASDINMKDKSFNEVWNLFKNEFWGYDVLKPKIKERLSKALYKFYIEQNAQ
jgi:hypothetical protein